MYLFGSLCIVLVQFVLHINYVSTNETFIVSFQSSVKGSQSPSTDEWIEYLSTIPPSREFTACNWIRGKYFGRDIAMVLWSYCTNDGSDNSINCLQLFLKNKRETANRHVEAYGWFPWSNQTCQVAKADISPYAHRMWFHLCWSYSTLSGMSKIYYNTKQF